MGRKKAMNIAADVFVAFMVAHQIKEVSYSPANRTIAVKRGGSEEWEESDIDAFVDSYDELYATAKMRAQAALASAEAEIRRLEGQQ